MVFRTLSQFSLSFWRWLFVVYVSHMRMRMCTRLCTRMCRCAYVCADVCPRTCAQLHTCVCSRVRHVHVEMCIFSSGATAVNVSQLFAIGYCAGGLVVFGNHLPNYHNTETNQTKPNKTKPNKLIITKQHQCSQSWHEMTPTDWLLLLFFHLDSPVSTPDI